MSGLGKSCLKLLITYALIAAAVGVVVYHRFPEPAAAFWGGVIGGFFLWLVFGYLIAIPSHLHDWWVLSSGRPPRDGKRVQIVGQIRPMGASAHSPLTKTACAAYHTKIISLGGQHQNTDYESFQIVPSTITTNEGQVRVLAWPELDFPWERVRGQEVKLNAQAYIESTSFVDTVKGGFRGIFAEVRKLASDDDGAIRYDFRIEPVAASLDQCVFEERLVLPGDTVCAIGRYDEQRKALVPDPKAAMWPIILHKGAPGSFQRRAFRKAIGSAIGVVICSAIVAFAAGFFLVNVPLDASEQRNPERRFFWEEVKLERWLEANVIEPLSKADALNSRGMFFLTLCNGCATGKLEANGRVVDLRHAEGTEDEARRVIRLSAAPGERDGVTIVKDRKSGGVKVTIVMNGREFPVPDAWLRPNDYQSVLDNERVYDGRLTIIGPGDELRVRTSFRVVLPPDSV